MVAGAATLDGSQTRSTGHNHLDSPAVVAVQLLCGCEAVAA
jgi:hypothetical protein